MDRRPGQQRLILPQIHGRPAHIHGDRLAPCRRPHPAPAHLHRPPAFHLQRPPRRQRHPRPHQHHRQAGQGLREQVPRVQERRELPDASPRLQPDPPNAAALEPAADKIPHAANEQGQQAQAVDSHPQGQGAQQRAAGEQEQGPAQDHRGHQQGKDRPQILPPPHQKGRGQQADHPAGQAQQPRKPAQGQGVPHRPQEGHKDRPPRLHLHAAQRPRQVQQEQVDGHVVQQKPLQGHLHATSTTMTVMSSRCPLRRAAAKRSSATCCKDAPWVRLSSSSSSLPSRSYTPSVQKISRSR